MGRESLQELLEQYEEDFRYIANDDELPPWFRYKYGRAPLDELENLQMEGGEPRSSAVEGGGKTDVSRSIIGL